MKLENQVTNLELSKKLKELGVKQESLFYWQKGFFTTDDWGVVFTFKKSYFKEDEYMSAFTVAELGEMLPGQIEIDPEWFDLDIQKLEAVLDEGTAWGVRYYKEAIDVFVETEIKKVGDTLADALAKMLIYLIENNLLPKKEDPNKSQDKNG